MSFPSKQPAFYHVFHTWGGGGWAAKSRYRNQLRLSRLRFSDLWLVSWLLKVLSFLLIVCSDSFGFWFYATQSGSALLVPRHIPVGFNDCYWNSEQRSSLWTANVVSGNLKQSHEILVSASSLCNYFSAPQSLLQTCQFNYLSIMRPVRQTQRINLDIEIAH